jgi:hypothetical protein
MCVSGIHSQYHGHHRAVISQLTYKAGEEKLPLGCLRHIHIGLIPAELLDESFLGLAHICHVPLNGGNLALFIDRYRSLVEELEMLRRLGVDKRAQQQQLSLW